MIQIVFEKQARERFEYLHSLFYKLIKKVNHMSAATDTLAADVAANKAAIDQAVTILNGIPALVASEVSAALASAAAAAQAANDAAVAAAAAGLEGNTTALAAAVTAASQPPVAPTPAP